MAVSSNTLWFAIESAFEDIERACTEARAAELAVQMQRRDSMGSRRPPPPGGAMEPAPGLGDTANEREMRALDLAKSLAFREAHPDGADFVELRARIRKRLQWLKGKLLECFSDHVTYYALFPIVVYTDELVASVAQGQAGRWQPLQGELYDVENGGELFFSITDERLREEETHPLIFEVLYFCLSDGFVGMYDNDPKKIEEYKARIKARIPVVNPDSPEVDARPAHVTLVAFPWRYYAAACASVFLVWVVLHILGATS